MVGSGNYAENIVEYKKVIFFFLQLYGCPRYEQFVKAEFFNRRNDAAIVKEEMIDIKPHPPYGTKAARKAAKERAAERAREREMEKQKTAGSNPMNFYAR